MNRTYAGATVVVLSAILLLFTAHPVFFGTLLVSGFYTGYVEMDRRYGDADGA